MTINSHPHIDIPFNLRHTCWFCGEPSIDATQFPRKGISIDNIQHAPLSIPACKECISFRYSKDITSIWSLRDHIKQSLIHKYAKHLGVGENWTQQELVDCDFSGSALGGFGRSAWKMYEIAKQRVDYKGWPLSVGDIPLDTYDDTSGFEFDGTRYASLKSCIDYFTIAAGVDKELLTHLIDIVSSDRFAYALQIAKLNKNLSKMARSEIIEEVLLQESEQEEIQNGQECSEPLLTDTIEAVTISGTTVPVFAIVWALSKNVKDLSHLCSLEDDYFDDFEHLGGPAAFMSYNGLQLYLESRENPEWVEKYDPNKTYWDEYR